MTRQLRKLQNTYINDDWLTNFRRIKREIMSLYPPLVRSSRDMVATSYAPGYMELIKLLDEVERRYNDRHYPGLVQEIALMGEGG